MPLRVALCLDGLGRGGTERHTVRLANALHESGAADVWIACLDADGEFRHELRIPADRILTFPLPAFYHPRGLYQLVRFVRRAADEQWDVLHGQDFYGNILCTAAKGLLGRPKCIVSRRYQIREETAVQRLAETLSYRVADAVVFNSPSVGSALVHAGRVRSAQVRVIPNGVECERFRGPSEMGRPATGGPDAPRIGAVARLVPVKDHATLLKAVAQLRVTYPSVRLDLVGDGPLRGRLASLAHDLGIEEAVTFAGDQEDVRPWLQSWDVGLLTSVNESSPNAVLEYMAAGLPVVATAVGGVPDLVRDGMEGHLCGRGDVAGIARALGSILGDRVRARSMSEAARARAETFSVRAMVSRTVSLYRSMVAAGEGTPVTDRSHPPELPGREAVLPHGAQPT